MFVKFKKSTLENKKMMAEFFEIQNVTKSDFKIEKVKTTHFGEAGARDYTLHKDPERKKRYIERHEKSENWNDPTSAGALSRWILWNKPTKTESIKDYKNKFGIY